LSLDKADEKELELETEKKTRMVVTVSSFGG